MNRLYLLLLGLMLLAVAAPASAAIDFSLRTGNNATKTQSMPIDSNQCGTQGPRAMYVGGIVTNSGASTATNIVATISGLGSGFFLAGGQPATQTIGALGPGQSTGVYWFVGYGCTMLATTTTTINFTSSVAPASTNVILTGRSAISANAGGQVVGSLLGPGAVVGQTIYFDATYSFGGSLIGDEFFLQPSGAQTFDAACFRMVGSEVRASTITPISVGTRNQIYFVQTEKQAGSGYTATIRYYFEYQCAGASTSARPYAVQTSGNTNIKYTGNFDGASGISISFPGAANPFTITKTSDISTAVAGTAATVRYTVTVSNPSAHASRISQIVDMLPAGASFVAFGAGSDVTAANSSSVPAAGATGTISFTGLQDLSYPVPAGGSVRLIYSVQMPSAAGSYPNSAQARFGTAATPVASAGFTVFVPQPLTVVKSSRALLDPYNDPANAKLIPGARVGYTITVANPHSYTVTSNSVVVIDATPNLLDLFVGDIAGVGGGPVLFQDGSPSSTLTYTYSGLASLTDDVDFSSDGGTSWNHVPTPDANGSDAAVTHIRIRPKGAMAAGSSFSLLVGYYLL
jgi:uncharacterized repeat protein (TIGR01451 family)